MLSPDNYVQSPNSSQSFNRYSYCWNNPLKYTDPSGEIIEGVIVATVGFTVGYVSHGIRNNDWGKDALVSGAISAAVATIGFYSGGAAISAKSAFAYSGKFAANAAINSVIPPAQVQMGNVNMSIGIGVGFGTTGFGATGSFGIGFKNDCFSFGIGLGGNDNMVAWNPMVQDRTQNWVHKNGFFYMPFGHANFFSNYSNFKKGGFSYSGYNNPFSLW